MKPGRQKIVLTNYVTDKVGLPTLQDIMAELAKPGRDPREQFENVVFAEGIDKYRDLIAGHETDRRGHEYHGLWRFCGYRRPSGRSGSFKRNGRPICQSPRRMWSK